MTLTNAVPVSSTVVNLTSADVTLDTDRHDCSFKINEIKFSYIPFCAQRPKSTCMEENRTVYCDLILSVLS